MSVPGTEALAALTAAELVEFNRTLEAPEPSEMNGHFPSVGLLDVVPFLRQPPSCKLVSVVAANVLNPRGGTWVGKAFDGGGPDGGGRGYNYFQRDDGKVIRRLPFATRVGPSFLDGEPTFQMYYSAYHSIWGDTINLVDEVRRIGPERYLLIGLAGFRRPEINAPMMVELTGPASPYEGDVGRRRTGFDPATAYRAAV